MGWVAAWVGHGLALVRDPRCERTGDGMGASVAWKGLGLPGLVFGLWGAAHGAGCRCGDGR